MKIEDSSSNIDDTVSINPTIEYKKNLSMKSNDCFVVRKNFPN